MAKDIETKKSSESTQNTDKKRKIDSYEDEDLPRGVDKKKKSTTKPVKKPLLEVEDLFGSKETAKEDKAPAKKAKKAPKEKEVEKKPKKTEKARKDLSDDEAADPEEKEVNAFFRMSTKPPTSAVEITHRKLSPGTLVLGTVAQINHADLSITLPGHLKGYLHITEISTPLSNIIAAAATGQDVQVPKLTDLYRLGMYVHVIVTKIDTASEQFRIELSAKPELVNARLQASHLTAGRIIVAAVDSIEEKGYGLQLGVDGVDTFILKDQVEKEEYSTNKWGNEGRRPQKGELLPVIITEKKGRVVKVSLKWDKIQQHTTKEEDVLTMDTLYPGMLVRAKVNEVLDNGLFLNFLGYFVGTVHRDVMLEGSAQKSEKVKARILSINYETKQITLGTKKHLTSFVTWSPENMKVGDRVKGRVLVIHKSYALLRIDGSKPPQTAFLGGTYEDTYKPGQDVPLRVIHFEYTSGFLGVSDKKEVLEQPLMTADDLKPGQRITAKIKSINPKGIEVNITAKISGFIPNYHISDAQLSADVISKKFHVGQSIAVRVLFIRGMTNIHLTHRESLVKTILPTIGTEEEVKADVVTLGWIQKVSPQKCYIGMWGELHGVVNRSGGESFEDLYTRGKVLKVRVLGFGPEKKYVRLSFDTQVTGKSKKSEEKVIGKTIRGNIEGFRVKLPGNFIAFLAKHHLSDYNDHVDPLFRLYTDKNFPQLVVLRAKDENYLVSAKPSLVWAAQNKWIPENRDDMKDDTYYVGYVAAIKHTSSLDVRFLEDVRGHIAASRLPAKFNIRNVALGTTLYVRIGKKLDDGGIALSLRPEGPHDHYGLPDLFRESSEIFPRKVQQGDRLKVKVEGKREPGVYNATTEEGGAVLLSKTEVEGEVEATVVDCHSAAIVLTTDERPNLKKKLVTGQKRTVTVIDLITDHYLLLSRKGDRGIGYAPTRTTHSLRNPRDYYKVGDAVDVDIIEGEGQLFFEVRKTIAMKERDMRKQESKGEVRGEEEGEEKEEVKVDNEKKRKGEEEGKPAKKAKVEEEEEEDESMYVDKSETVDTKTKTMTVPSTEEEGEEEVAEEDLAEEAMTSKEKKMTAREKRAEKKKEEAAIAEKEEAKLEGTPQTAADFERMLLSSPDSAYLWVQYMAFCVSTTDIEKARKVAERATKSMSSRQKEKVDVWVARINLEHLYGDDESTQKIMNEAIQYNDPLQIYLRVLEAYAASGETEKQGKLFEKVLKKHKEEEGVWMKYLEYLLTSEQSNKCKEALDRALRCIPKNKHVETISRYAQLEYKHGTVERARTVFEGVLSNFPKRSDVWNVYLDKEIQVGDIQYTRRLLDRITSLKLSSKTMKTFFKRFMAFEKENGDEESVEGVRQKAIKYVEAK
ncbi:hypothetical protein PROFUN_08639 [Planoprotostelium fungivorum]|uniref:S1 motif domain-containing protein n=1 Tax=Planoprotostelium fungivorum TaxID=1890364 RepID=A0A2P6NJ21_9EUKA|nr:hypothetical protein PROFUN_13515 [Planoprotostelium fungivorum]PRP83955.1 hypothetical protein PROFUN_08639 [Planoprotostelium fungivorum]